MYPVQTLKEKEEIRDQAVAEGWYLFLEHDADKKVITIKKENGRFTVRDSLKLSDL
jgi:hypothetical protein